MKTIKNFYVKIGFPTIVLSAGVFSKRIYIVLKGNSGIGFYGNGGKAIAFLLFCVFS